MTQTPAERNRLQTILYELSSAAFYLSRLPGDEAAAIRQEVLTLVARCQTLMQETTTDDNPDA